MRGAARSLIVLLCVLSTFACKKETASSEASIDLARAGAEIESRMAHLWERPIVAKATDAFFDSLGSSALLKERGVALLAQLQSDPAIAKPIESLMAELTTDPSIQTTVAELMAEHPGATADDIGKMVGDRFAQAWASPQVTAAWQTAWDGLLRKITGDPDLATIQHSVFVRFSAKYSDAAVLSKWNKRMSELGPGLSRDKATDLFMTKFFAPDRIESLVADALGNPTFRNESAAALAKLIALDSVTKNVHTGAAEMLADPAVHDAAVVLMKQLTSKSPDGPSVAHALDKLLGAPSVVKTVRAVIHTAGTDPAVAAIGNVWLDKLSQDAGLQSDFDKFCYGW